MANEFRGAHVNAVPDMRAIHKAADQNLTSVRAACSLNAAGASSVGSSRAVARSTENRPRHTHSCCNGQDAHPSASSGSACTTRMPHGDYANVASACRGALKRSVRTTSALFRFESDRRVFCQQTANTPKGWTTFDVTAPPCNVHVTADNHVCATL